MRKLTPQPFPNIEEVAKGNLDTKQNQELQTIIKDLQSAPLNKNGFTFFPIVSNSAGLTSTSPPVKFGFQEFKCKKEDIVLYQGMIFFIIPPGGFPNLQWRETDISLDPSSMMSWNNTACVYNAPVNPGYIYTTIPFIRYFKAAVDNPRCGYQMAAESSSVGTFNFVLLAAYYQVFR